MKDTLVIMGSHPRTRGQFNFERLDCDIWVFNEAISGGTFPRADVVFQMHEEAIWRNPANRNDPGHFNWLTTQIGCTVYMQEWYEEVPRCERYPIGNIRKMLGDARDHFLTSSVAQAMALAAWLGCYKRIEIYGVAMETNTEYQFQREGVAHWLGYLRGKGIDVYFADETFIAPLYGYEGEVVIDYHRFEERIVELAEPIGRVTAEHQAAMQSAEIILRKYVEDSGKETENELTAAIQSLASITDHLGVLDGARQENEKYKAKADTMKDAAGEFLFSRQEFESSAKNLMDRSEAKKTEYIAAGTTLHHLQNNVRMSAKGSKKRAEAAQVFSRQLVAYLQAVNAHAVFKGASQENFNYMAYLDKHIRAAGGAKSEQVLLEVLQNA